MDIDYDYANMHDVCLNSTVTKGMLQKYFV